MGLCKWKSEFQVEHTIETKDPLLKRRYKIRWVNYSQEWDTWEPRPNLHTELISDFEKSNGAYEYDPPLQSM